MPRDLARAHRAGSVRDRPGRRTQATSDATIAAAEHAELRLLELLPVEGDARDQQRDREADAGDGAAAGDHRPAQRRAQPAEPGRDASHAAAMIPSGLPTT